MPKFLGEKRKRQLLRSLLSDPLPEGLSATQNPGNHPKFRKNALGVERPFSELSESSGVFLAEKAILGIRHHILEMATHNLSNTKATILGATPGAIPQIDRNPQERFSSAPAFSERVFKNWCGSPAPDKRLLTFLSLLIVSFEGFPTPCDMSEILRKRYRENEAFQGDWPHYRCIAGKKQRGQPKKRKFSSLLEFPSAVILNAVVCRNMQMSAKSANERKRAQTQVRKRAQKSAKVIECFRGLHRGGRNFTSLLLFSGPFFHAAKRAFSAFKLAPP